MYAAPSGSSLQTTVALTGSYANLAITKDIYVEAANATSFANESVILQTYHPDGPTNVDEPAPLGIMAVGLLGMAMILRRRGKASGGAAAA